MKEDALDPVWKALADPTRRRILDLLNGQARTTGELAAAFPHLSRFAVMKHLASLEEANLVLVRRKGRERWNHLNAVPIREIYELWIDAYEGQWATSLLRMREVAEVQYEQQEEQRMSSSTGTPIDSMAIEQEVPIAAPVATVFRAFIEDISTWREFRLIGGDLALDISPGGAFVETRADGAAVMWATVVRFEEDQRLTLNGPLGSDGAVVGVIDYRFEASGENTVLKLSHTAIGAVSDEDQENYYEGVVPPSRPTQELRGNRGTRSFDGGDLLTFLRIGQVIRTARPFDQSGSEGSSE